MNEERYSFKTIALLMLFGAALVLGVLNFSTVWRGVRHVLGLCTPFILGGCMAFILNVPMSFLERRLAANRELRWKRPAALLAALALTAAVVGIVLFLVLPQLASTIGIIIEGMPAALRSTVRWLNQMFDENPFIMEWLSAVNLKWSDYVEKIGELLNAGLQGVLNSTVSILSGTLSTIVNSLIGFVFAIYILLQKERLSGQCRQVIRAYVPQKHAERIFYVLRLTHKTFHKFLTGQCCEAVILGGMFLVSMSLLKIPYALLISVLITATALIPIFGAFIGCAVGALLILFVDPMQALWFLILFLVLQQVEGNLIYPYVVGNSVGLPAIWVLVAVTVGGNLMGVIGMLVFIPLTSVLYSLFRSAVKRRLSEQGGQEQSSGD